jgi:hypothetical protein
MNLKKPADAIKYFGDAYTSRIALNTCANRETIRSAGFYALLLFQSKKLPESRDVYL